MNKFQNFMILGFWGFGALRFEIGKLAANLILERNDQKITNTAKTIELETIVDIGTSI